MFWILVTLKSKQNTKSSKNPKEIRKTGKTIKFEKIGKIGKMKNILKIVIFCSGNTKNQNKRQKNLRKSVKLKDL